MKEGIDYHMKEWLEKCSRLWEKHMAEKQFYLLLWIFSSVGIQFILQVLSSRSLLKTLGYVVSSPMLFLYNTLIIMATLSVMFLFKRRFFVGGVIATLWIAVGVTDFVLLSTRTTPFTAQDLKLIKYAISIIGLYLPIYAIVALVMLIFLVIGLMGYVFFKAPKVERKINRWRNVLLVGTFIFGVLLCTDISVKAKLLETKFPNIAKAYQEYGIPYCFLNTLLNTGIDKPKDYNDEVVKDIEDFLEDDTTTASNEKPTVENSSEASSETSSNEEPITEPTKEPPTSSHEQPQKPDSTSYPNVIVLQLETFFDVQNIIGLEFSEDPIPYFRKLMKNYTTGKIAVPCVGAGTANTEFEVLTGMNLDFFGPGEYPYKTILKDVACESIAFNYGELGFAKHIMHNNEGTFYDRHTVFSKLGFDTFTSMEYMKNIERNEIGWIKDHILVAEIMNAIHSTEERDVVYAISVQAHGAYPTTPVVEFPEIFVSGEDFTEEELNQYLYYVNQLYEVDLFVKELIEEIEKNDEPTVLVMFGDHLPSLELSEEDLLTNSLFDTDYVIWDNIGLDKEDKDLEAYQLMAYTNELLGIHNGVITKYHQKYFRSQTSEEEYLEKLNIIEYDVLYGDNLIYKGKNPYEPSDMKMGIDEILITGVHYEGKDIYVEGENFTEYSCVYVDGKKNKTIFVNEKLLCVKNETAKQSISVGQVGPDKILLSITPLYYLEE